MSNNKDNEVGSAREVPGTLETEQLVDALEAPMEQADAVDIPLELNSCPQQPHQDSALPTPLDDKRSLVMPKVESVKDVKANGTYNLEPETCAGDGIAVSSSHVETAKPTVDAEIKPSDIQGATGHDTWAVVKRSNEPAVPQAGSSDDEAKGDNKRGSDDAKNNIDIPSPKSNGNSTPRRTFLLDENSGGSESGTEEEQNDFLSELHSFFSEKSMEFKPPKFYGDLLNCLKLWRSVMRLGGYDKVTSCKLWRQVGESFKSPKTCTTISWTFRGFYEKVLLDYERHITNAGEPDIPVASKSEPKQLKPPKLSRSEPVHVDNQASGSDRTRRDAAARAMQGWHSLRFLGNGEDKNTVPVQKREKELKNIGLLKRKKPSYVEHAVKSPRTKSARLDVEVTDIGAPKDSFDVYALVPGLLREEVRVQSDPAGRLVISGEPEHEDNPWGCRTIQKRLSTYPRGLIHIRQQLWSPCMDNCTSVSHLRSQTNQLKKTSMPLKDKRIAIRAMKLIAGAG
uniref:AT-rich interactive domain-containing protein 6-like isoform X2 n=1 Tax=Populus alba TaxID=43335 RepID=A0A4U5PZ38_POPAL|nr:AT-rich interactive domain-containing protein 6-like isoform X2 [Populus alba]